MFLSAGLSSASANHKNYEINLEACISLFVMEGHDRPMTPFYDTENIGSKQFTVTIKMITK